MLFNKTSIQNIELIADDGSIYIPTKGILPKAFSVPTASTYSEYEIATPITSNSVITGKAVITAVASVNPVGDLYNATCVLFEQGTYVNTDTGMPELGYENNVGTYAGQQNAGILNMTFKLS